METQADALTQHLAVVYGTALGASPLQGRCGQGPGPGHASKKGLTSCVPAWAARPKVLYNTTQPGCAWHVAGIGGNYSSFLYEFHIGACRALFFAPTPRAGGLAMPGRRSAGQWVSGSVPQRFTTGAARRCGRHGRSSQRAPGCSSGALRRCSARPGQQTPQWASGIRAENAR